MKKIRFLHIADLHLDSPFIGLKNLPNSIFMRLKESTFKSLTKIIDIAIKEKVDFVIMAGDLYDQEDRSIRAQTQLRKEMERLNELNIQAYVVHGNHDHTGGNWMKIEWPDNVHIFSDSEVEKKVWLKDGKALAALYGFSYGQRAVTNKMIHHYQKSHEEVFHIGILHGSIEGNTEHNQFAPFKLTELIEKQFDYWALGHIHKRQILSESPPIIYSGNIQGRHKKETGPKGCYLVELTHAGATYSFFNTAEIIWETVVVSITALESIDHLLTQCYQSINEIRDEEKGYFVTLILRGAGYLNEQLNDTHFCEELRQILNEEEEDKHNFVWITSLKNETTPIYDKEQLKSEATFLGELLTVIENYSNYEQTLAPIYSHPQARKYIERFTEDDLEEMKEEAEKLLIHELLQNQLS